MSHRKQISLFVFCKECELSKVVSLVPSSVVQEDQLFLILYKELYYRHIYARVQGGPTIEQRFESYYNYCNLFNFILSSDTPVTLELPNQWLWEIIDEFIYQFQSFQQFRAKLHKKSQDEIEVLRHNPRVWDVLQVLNVLHSMVDKSNINQQLEVSLREIKPVLPLCPYRTIIPCYSDLHSRR